MCPKRTRHRALSQANMRAPISGLFVFRPFAQSSIVLPYSKIELLKNRRTANILSGFIDLNDYRQPPASRWAQAPSHLQHPASLDSQREDAHSAGFLILLTRMAEKTALTNYLLGLVGVALD